jgi:hypothetical protein
MRHSLLHAIDQLCDRMTVAHPRLTRGLIAERMRAGEYHAGQCNNRYQTKNCDAVHVGHLYPAHKIDDESDDEQCSEADVHGSLRWIV